MKSKKIISLALSLTLLPTVGAVTMPTMASAAASGTVVRLDPSEASPFNNGEFQGWGTSMGWWGNRIGYSNSLAEQAAKAFYSEEGLSLDIVRYNVGGGDDPSHNHITRSDSKLPCLAEPQYNDDGSLKKDENGDVIYDYNWDADYNQVNVLKKIKEENPDVHIEGYTNSPPWFMTESGCSSGGTNAGDENLSPDNYDIFADFLADVTEHFDEIGLKFDSYSPMNEPNPATKYWTALSPKQEGNLVAQGEHQSGLINALSDAYDARNIDTLVVGPDETSIDYTISSYNAMTDTAKANLDRIDTHTYSGSNRAGLKSTAINAGKNLWMSEVDGGWNGFGLADRIILDVNGMQPSAWVMWDIVDSHKDSNFTDPSGNKTEANNSLNVTGTLWGVVMANHDTETLELSNKYYAFGQFTKYINPGDTIIASSSGTLAAYNKKSGDIKIVVSNSGSADIPYTFDLSAFTSVGSAVKEIRSNNLTGDSAEHWKEIEGEATLADKKITTTAKAGTVTTYIVEGSAAPDYGVIKGGSDQIKLGASAVLTFETNMDVSGGITWTISDSDTASIAVSEDTKECTVTANKAGAVTVTATVGEYAFTREFTIPMYTLTGTASWGNDSNRPADSADYTKAADGDLSTYFDGTTGGYVQYDYGTRFKISEIKLAARSGGADYANRTVGGTVQGSNDAVNWTDIYKITSAIPADEYTTIETKDLLNRTSYRYYRYTNSENMANIAEFLLVGEVSDESPVEVTEFEASKSGLSYSYNVSDEFKDCKKYFAVYDGDKKLKKVTIDTPTAEDTDDYSGSSFKLFVWDNMTPKAVAVDKIEPEITDIDGLTDDFEGVTNIFGASAGALADGNIVFASGLDRYGNVFAPVKSTASASLSEPVTLTSKDKFRLTFTMFAGWESNGKDNTFALKDKDGNEIAALYMTGGGYNFNQIRIGGENVLSAATVSQSRSNPGTNKAGANGWNASGQPYVNTVGYNKTVEIIIDGNGTVTISATGGIADTIVSGKLEKPVTIGSMALTGDYNSAKERTVSYDNFDADIITYKEDIAEPAAPTPSPEPTEAPVIPESGELISLNFDNGDLTSTSTYGKAEGSPKFVTVDDKKCIQLDGTAATAVSLTDANGNALLTGQKNISIFFKVKPTTTATSWWFYAAPNDSAQTYLQEKYLGAFTNADTLNVERYNNSGARSDAATPSYNADAWNDVIISVEDGTTRVYVNGEETSVSSTVDISSMLGTSSVAYIGRANWGSGEYASGYIDDFVIYNYAVQNPLASVDLGDLSNVTENITVPTIDGVTWETSNENVVTADGTVTRADETQTAVLTAKMTKDGINFKKAFDVTVPGYTAVLETFKAYADGNTIYYSADYDADKEKYKMSVQLVHGDAVTRGNGTSGSFTGLTSGAEYTIDCALTDTSGEISQVVKSISKTIKIKENDNMEAYLFVHFMNTEGDATCEQIYFSVSEDGQTWTTLNDKKPVLTSTVGEEGVRDPYILRGEDGKFFIIATDLSIYNRRAKDGTTDLWKNAGQKGSKSIVVWESTDLVNWSEASLVEINNSNAGCTWAPETVYDPEKGEYMVFWASTISDDGYAKYRIYRSYTSDFKTFSDPELYIEGSNAMIDTTIIDHKGVYYRFTKDETRSAVTMMQCNSLSGNWKNVDTYTLGDMTGYEGPTIYKMNGQDKWCLLLDYYSKSGGYKPFVTSDITTGNFTAASDFTFDGTYRHGTVMPITAAEYKALTEKQW